MPWTTRAIFFAFGGLIIAAMLSYPWLYPQALERLCGGSGGCIAVHTSKFAKIGPVPTAMVGFVFYSGALLAGLVSMALPPSRARRHLVVASCVAGLGSVMVSAGLMAVQFAVLKAFCALCALSACFSLLWTWSIVRARREIEQPSHWPAAAGLACTLAVICGIAFLALRQSQGQPVQMLAKVDGKLVTTLDLERENPPGLTRLDQDLYELKKNWLDQKIDRLLLEREAAARGTNPQQMIESEVEKRSSAKLAELSRWLEQRKLKDPNPEVPWWHVEMKSKQDIRRQSFEEWLAELRAKSRVELFLPRPPQMLEYDRALAHLRGPDDAPIRLVVFTDFQCPYCAELAGVLDQVLEKYSFDVSLALIQMPMDFHELARPAAEAAQCAAEQGRFWPFHDRLMKQHGQIEPRWEEYARDVGLNLEQFRQCLASGRAKAAVERSRQAGLATGLDGVPAVYLNGRKIGGALSFEELSALIELERNRLR